MGYAPASAEPFATILVDVRTRRASAQHRGECNDESSRSRSSRFGAFSGCGISPVGVSQSRWLHTYSSALRLCRSSLGYTPSVWATDLHTTTLHTESCLP